MALTEEGLMYVPGVLAGLRATPGLISRTGIIPMSHTQDMAGPLARSIEDLAQVLDALVGYDPADSITAEGDGHVPASYCACLDVNALRGARIGRLTQLFVAEPNDAEVLGVVNAAAQAMQRLGAEIIEVEIPSLPEPAGFGRLGLTLDEMEADLDAYLAARPSAPVRTFREIVASEKCIATVTAALSRSLAVDHADAEAAAAKLTRLAELRRSVLAAMAARQLDVLLYPVSRIRAPTIDATAPYNVALAPCTGLPAIAIAGGFTEQGLPVGVELLSRAWSEPRLIALSYAYEQGTHHRRPPATTPPLG